MSIHEVIQEMGEDNWLEQDPDNRGWCELCGEPYDTLGSPMYSEVGEFVDTRGDDTESPHPKHVIAHAQCGLDHGLELA